MKKPEILISDDMKSGGRVRVDWFSGYNDHLGLDWDEKAQERFDEIATIVERIEACCGKGNYHFELSEYISDPPYMIDIPHCLKSLVVYEITFVDLGRLSEVLEAYPKYTKRLEVRISTKEENINLEELHGHIDEFVFNGENTHTLICPSLSCEKLTIDAPMVKDFQIGQFMFIALRSSYSLGNRLNWKYNSEFKADELIKSTLDVDHTVSHLIHPGNLVDIECVTMMHRGCINFCCDDAEAEIKMHQHAISYVQSMTDKKLKHLCRIAQRHTELNSNAYSIRSKKDIESTDAIFWYMGQEYRNALEQAFAYKANILDELCAAKMGESGYDEAKYHFIRSFRGWFQVLSSIHQGE